MNLIRKIKKQFSAGDMVVALLVICIVFLIVIILGLLPIAIVIFFIKLVGFNLEEVKVAAEVVNLVYIGIGALFAGTSFFPIAWKLFKEYRRREKVILLRSIYPVSDYKNQFDFVHYPEGTVYLRKIKEVTLFHIANPNTVYDLGFSALVWNKEEYSILTKKEFDSYKIGEPIDTVIN